MPSTRGPILLAMLAVMAFGWLSFLGWRADRPAPSENEHALVVHVVTGSCERSGLPSGLLMLYDTPEGAWGKRSERAWEPLRPVGDCAEAADGTAAVQAWATAREAWARDLLLMLLAGSRMDADPLFVSPPASRLRVDHAHVLLGRLDLTGSEPSFAPAADVPAYAKRLADRQDCDRGTWGACGADWGNADPLTFAPIRDTP